MITIRPIRYTADVPGMQAWAEALGMVTVLQTPTWVVLTAGNGRLALHAVEQGDPAAGSTTLAVETDDLDALAGTWEAAGIATRRLDGDIPLLFGTTPFGGEIAAGALSPSDGAASADGPDPDLSVMPMLATSRVPEAAEWFTSWGLLPRISSEGGEGWRDLEVPDGGGLVGLHRTEDLASEPPAPGPAAPESELHEIGVGLTFESVDVDAMLVRVRDALTGAHVVDEAYNRTLLVPSPDGDTIWVNGRITDLYGYREA